MVQEARNLPTLGHVMTGMPDFQMVWRIVQGYLAHKKPLPPRTLQ